MRTIDDLDWPVRTSRLTIRRATADDLAATWEIRRLDEVAEWVGAAPRTMEDYATSYLEPGRMADTLIIELGGKVIGDLMIDVQDGWSQKEVADRARGSQAELGWTLHPDHSGQGYATEAVAELMRICFEDLGLHRVIAQCFADNEASWRLMERLRMRREQHNVRESLHRDHGWLDGLGYAMLADEWHRHHS